ncbi:MAG: NAD-dependent epimerase/dehydratase family protein [Ilumatobacteraceae bacterium]
MIETAPGAAPCNLRGARCVVTGGLGFIGSNLVHALLRAEASVVVIDALVASHGGDRRNVAPACVETVIAGIGDGSVAAVVEGADIVFNLAGQVSHIESMTNPQQDLQLNVMDHAQFLETLRRVSPLARIVHASTRQVYGKVSKLPVDETTAAHPVDVNGVAKLAGEQLHLVYAQAYGMATTSLRLSNVYGPRQRLTSDELGFLPVFFRKVLLGETIELFGDGSQRRDCLYVDDVVAAFIAATADTAVGRVYNVGHRLDVTLAEIAEMMIAAAGSSGGVRYVPWPGDHERIAIGSFKTDSTRIGKELGWASSIDLVDGIAQTLSFYRDHPWYLSST